MRVPIKHFALSKRTPDGIGVAAGAGQAMLIATVDVHGEDLFRAEAGRGEDDMFAVRGEMRVFVLADFCHHPIIGAINADRSKVETSSFGAADKSDPIPSLRPDR